MTTMPDPAVLAMLAAIVEPAAAQPAAAQPALVARRAARVELELARVALNAIHHALWQARAAGQPDAPALEVRHAELTQQVADRQANYDRAHAEAGAALLDAWRSQEHALEALASTEVLSGWRRFLAGRLVAGGYERVPSCAATIARWSAASSTTEPAALLPRALIAPSD